MVPPASCCVGSESSQSVKHVVQFSFFTHACSITCCRGGLWVARESCAAHAATDCIIIQATVWIVVMAGRMLLSPEELLLCLCCVASGGWGGVMHCARGVQLHRVVRQEKQSA